MIVGLNFVGASLPYAYGGNLSLNFSLFTQTRMHYLDFAIEGIVSSTIYAGRRLVIESGLYLGSLMITAFEESMECMVHVTVCNELEL